MATFAKAPRSSVIYYDIPSVEDVFLYTEGGLHPIQVGDTLHGGQFKILNKLGYGAHSTVWLSIDNSPNRLVALKILRGDISLVGVEAELVGTLAAHQDRSLFALPEQIFKIEGPNGSHEVAVLPLAGSTLSQYMDELEENRLPVHIINKAIREIIRGMACLHQSGVSHGGLYPWQYRMPFLALTRPDLHTSNVLLRIPESALKNNDELLACFDSPSSEPIVRMDGKPLTEHAPELVFLPAKFSSLGNFDGSIMIADFGSTFKPSNDGGNAKFSVYAPTAAPERLLGGDFGLSSDIWSLACTIFRLISGKELFLDESMSPQMVLLEIMEVLGKPSWDWWRRWGKAAIGMEISPRDAVDCNDGPGKLEEMIDGLEDESIEKNLLKDMLKWMLVLEPEKRLTIEEVQDHAWLRSL